MSNKALAAVTAYFTNAQLHTIKEQFDQADKNKDNVLEFSEFKKLFGAHITVSLLVLL
jgi:hypothetical protein